MGSDLGSNQKGFNFYRLIRPLLDRTNLFSYTKTGFFLHQKTFDLQGLDVDMTGKVCLVTGANSGLGYATALMLAARGARVGLLCRSRVRANESILRIRAKYPKANLIAETVDVAEPDSVHQFCDRFKEKVDVLVNNAGVLPKKLKFNSVGMELTWATNVAGPFLLTKKLIPQFQTGARIVNITSGGAFLRKLDLNDINFKKNKYIGVAAYANSKRAEILLNEEWAKKYTDFYFYCTHPGWADTKGLRVSLPRFYRLVKYQLRSAEEGADTALWLSLKERGPSGTLWFDRKMVRRHAYSWTKESLEERERLWDLCETF